MPSPLEKPVLATLERTGTGWKSITGVALSLILMVAWQMGWISEEQFLTYYPMVTMVFQVGVIHKQGKQS